MKVNLKKKMKEYGKKVLLNKESAKAERKKRRKAQHLRRAIRKQNEERKEQLDALIEDELEKEKIMDEYLGEEAGLADT